MNVAERPGNTFAAGVLGGAVWAELASDNGFSVAWVILLAFAGGWLFNKMESETRN